MASDTATTASCRLTGTPLEVVLDLGEQPLGNGFLSSADDFASEYFYSMRCGFATDSLLFQLIDQPDPGQMFHSNYAFQSSTSGFMSAHFKALSQTLAEEFLAVNADPLVVEIGSNDGVFLKHFASRGVRHVGVEPSDNVATIAEAQGVQVERRFFSADTAAVIRESNGPAHLIYAANALCHIPDIRGIVEGIDLLLAEDGVFVFEDPYLGDVVKLASYDQIYDEHVFLFSGMSVARIFTEAGLELIDLEHLPTHGGSMRYTLGRRGVRKAKPRVESTLASEREQGLHETVTFCELADRVARSASDLKRLLEHLAGQGHQIVSYGATSKSTTVYNYAKIGPELISEIYDSTPNKQGKFSPGVHIPVVPESDFVDSGARFAFLGAWNHEKEIRMKNEYFEARGGRWITHVPQVRLLGD